MKGLFIFLFVTCLNFCCGNKEAKNEKNLVAAASTEDHLFLCIITNCKKNAETKNGIVSSLPISNINVNLNRVKRKGGRGGGGFGGFRGASAARAASGARFSPVKVSGSGSRGTYAGTGGGTVFYGGNGNLYHSSPGSGTWPNNSTDVIFVIVLLIGSAVFLVCFCSYLSKDDGTGRKEKFSPPKRYPDPPKQKVYAFFKNKNQQQQNIPPPIYEM
uniref:Glycine-rich protein n=1 Tax=Panagrolaimus sp. PS1159 TaxID=55785 RepID=A0AC35GXE8_9BILA